MTRRVVNEVKRLIKLKMQQREQGGSCIKIILQKIFFIRAIHD